LRLSTGACDALVTHDWPGNVRELERLIERAVALASSDVIEIADLPEPLWHDLAAIVLPSLERNDTMRAWGARYARLMVERCGGRRSEAARALGISYHTLKGYLKHPAPPAAAADHREEESPIADMCVES
jgi:DNA-binding NtrC family response regulator